MSAFDWTERDGLDEVERYPLRAGDFLVRGRNAWQRLWEHLLALAQNTNEQAPWDEALQDFFEEAAKDPRPPAGQVPCCVFVSHRRVDFAYAERIAWLAAQHGLQYWLDIHDPTLAAANRVKLPSPAKEVLIAAVIEMGLLNSTHVIAVHTQNSDGSKWIPYELGRVKQRRLFSTRACGWFDPTGTAPVAGEYTFLAARTRSDGEVDSWLGKQAAGTGPRSKCRVSGLYWIKPRVPKALPSPGV
jgi:hypothetical protein